MLKTYTITAAGQTSNGNDLTQPFTLELHAINMIADGIEESPDGFMLHVCVKNDSGDPCRWDQLDTVGWGEGFKFFSGVSMAMSNSNNTNLANTLEVDLEAIVPGAWS